MASVVQNKKNSRNNARKQEKKISRGKYIWLFLLTVVTVAGTYIGIVSYREHVDPIRVYGKWTEIGGPEWARDEFILSVDGVMKDNRYLATSFTFDGNIVGYRTGDQLIELQVFGNDDERLRRVTGGGHATSFIKEGFEHTLPKQDNVGPARRVSLAEHFQSKK